MIEKVCTLCKVSKALTDFYPSKALKSGRRSRCKACEVADGKVRVAEWVKKNPERARATRLAGQIRNREKINARSNERTKLFPEQVKEVKRRYREKNKEKLREADRLRRLANPARRKAAVAKYDAKNRGRNNARCAERRRICARTPSWDVELDSLVFEEAALLRELRQSMCGGIWHIDHIEPLRGKLVSGLHNAFNMAVIPAALNRRKGNKQYEGHWINHA